MRTAPAALLAASFLITASAAAQAADPIWSEQGRIEDGDGANASEQHYDDHRLRLEAGRRYRITASSDAFDTLLQLVSAEGEPLAENDDTGGTLNSRLIYAPEQSGDYVVRVLAFSPEGRGDYQAQVDALPPLPPVIVVQPVIETMNWAVYRGELTAEDGQNDGGAFDDYQIYLGQGEEALVRLDGTFDTTLSIRPADDRDGAPLASDDDGGGGLNSLLLFRTEEAGDYIVRVSAYNAGDGGTYRLRIGR